MNFQTVSAAAILAGSLVFAGVTGCQNNKTPTRPSSMPNLQEQVMERLKIFQDNNNLDALSQASNLVGSLKNEPSQFPSPRAFRTAKLKLWLTVLNAIDAKLDPDFDFSQLPEMSVAPPAESGMPAGVDPNSITNPAVRAKYQNDLSLNQQKTANYNFQKKLHKINDEDTTRTESHIAGNYSKSSEDVAELKQLIDETAADNRRKVTLKAFVVTRKNR